ncbi:BT_3928 family protein [Maribacter halichondriae]|uniref:BT_3928 family protein n=1 Tax=Maribacter halichondriae TaxID=2980554 RepID=UPI002359902E|nr:BT_3928 family protein [Maribacter sp. Hal144]
MKYLVGISRIFVGILFIISGLIKLNDPMGFSFKLEEYFSAGVLDLPFLEPYALAISIFVVIFEVLLGVMLLIGFKVKFTVWSLLLMIVFFTFLTFYSAYFNKVTDCGCFGDAIKLTPWESFTKDVILLVLILILFVGRKHITSILGPRIKLLLFTVALLLSGAYAYYVLNHLPVIDFRPYKMGANIEEGMSIPEGAPQAVYDYAWRFKTNDGDKIVVTQGEYPEVDGEFIDVETTEVQAGYEPPIHDFTIEQNGEDFSASLLQESKLVMVIAYDLRKSDPMFSEIKKVTDFAIQNHYKVIGMSASGPEISEKIVAQYNLNFEFYFTDETALKTIIRSNPGVMVLHRGTIEQKVHHNDLGKLEFTNDYPQALDLQLKKKLDSIMVLDQKYRANPSAETWPKQIEIDSSNLEFVEKAIEMYGYPGKSLVGESTQEVAWYVIQHSDKIDQYIDLIDNAAKEKELPFKRYAMMLDRHLVRQNKPQIYGTQGMSYFIGTPDEISIIWPLKSVDSVDVFRKEAGFEDTMMENAQRMFGPDFEFKEMNVSDVEALLNKMNQSTE